MRKLFTLLLVFFILFFSNTLYAYTGLADIIGVELEATYYQYNQNFIKGEFFSKYNSIQFIDEKCRYDGELFQNINVGNIIYSYDAATKKLNYASFNVYFSKQINSPDVEFDRDSGTVTVTYPYDFMNTFITRMCNYFNKSHGKYEKYVDFNSIGSMKKYVSYTWEATKTNVLMTSTTTELRTKNGTITLYEIKVVIYRN